MALYLACRRLHGLLIYGSELCFLPSSCLKFLWLLTFTFPPLFFIGFESSSILLLPSLFFSFVFSSLYSVSGHAISLTPMCRRGGEGKHERWWSPAWSSWFTVLSYLSIHRPIGLQAIWYAIITDTTCCWRARSLGCSKWPYEKYCCRPQNKTRRRCDGLKATHSLCYNRQTRSPYVRCFEKKRLGEALKWHITVAREHAQRGLT